ncbi:MAG: trypsin-like peptidase domain-containing protein [Candidatus Paceibacterota bacterium]|jgi:S1-C subfamily serine protease
MHKKPITITSKLILLVLTINIFIVSSDVYFPRISNAMSQETIKKLFMWPLNQIPEIQTSIINDENKDNNVSLNNLLPEKTEIKTIYEEKIDYEQRIINVVKQADQSVVSIVANKYLPVADVRTLNPFDVFGEDLFNPFGFNFEIKDYQMQPQGEQQYEKQEIASGSGFVITSDGYIVTNKHVISDSKAEYTVFLNDGSKYNAKIIAQDPLEDFALIKIDANNLKPLSLGDSSKLQLGQTVIAIGNALGEFQNTISVGVISGLNRSITASGGGMATEKLNDLLQTDAAINRGNSGGPLLSLDGKVIGMNTAVVASAQNIGFAIPINKIRGTIQQAIKTGKITVPYIGVYFIQIDQTESEKRKLDVDYGALLAAEKGTNAVIKDSPAEKAGLKDGDIILSVNKIKITAKSPLATVVRNYKPGDVIVLEVKRGQETLKINLILGEK